MFRRPLHHIAASSYLRRPTDQTLLRRTAFSQVAKLALPPRSRQRQYACAVEAEDPHNYSSGVYFPVELGNKFKAGRYRVVHKLGWGGYATVWLARDTLADSNVALKIVRMDFAAHEHRIMQHLRDSPVAHANLTHPGRTFVAQLLDDFDLGVSHKCLVLEVMGKSVASLTEESPGGRMPGNVAREVTYQIALGLDYLWKCGVAHGDLYGGNVLFTAPGISTLAEERIRSLLREPELGAIQRLDGDPSLGPLTPRYLVRPETFRGGNTEVRIADLGNAFFHKTPPKTLRTPWHMRAPEALFDQLLSQSVDMWSMGCLLFEIITGRSFISSMFADRFSTIEEIQSHIGPPPADWINNLDNYVRERIDEASLKCIDLDRYLRLAYDQDDAQLIDIEDDEDDYPIEEYERAKREFTDAELDALSCTISGLLAYDLALRGTPETLLRSPWFRKKGVEDHAAANSRAL